MQKIVRKTWKRSTSALITLAAIVVFTGSSVAGSSAARGSAQPEFIPETLGDAQKRIRIDHAQELLGRHYSRSQVKYGFDPVFLLSVIQSESRFNPEAKGLHGEIGLMQILPPTGKWMAEKSGQKWKGPKTLQDNVANIRLGAAYFAFLRDRFDMHARLYIAAYNMGQHGVDHALGKKILPKDYPGVVMKNYVEFCNALENSNRTPTAIQARR